MEKVKNHRENFFLIFECIAILLSVFVLPFIRYTGDIYKDMAGTTVISLIYNQVINGYNDYFDFLNWAFIDDDELITALCGVIAMSSGGVLELFMIKKRRFLKSAMSEYIIFKILQIGCLGFFIYSVGDSFFLVVGPGFWCCFFEAVAGICYYSQYYVGLIKGQKKQETDNNMLNKETNEKKEIDTSYAVHKNYYIKGITGQYEDLSIPMKMNEKIIIGRSPEFANVVLFDDSVSKVHCTLNIDSEDRLIINDSSVNGTYYLDGKRVPQGEEVIINKEDKFYIATPNNIFQYIIEETETDKEQAISDESNTNEDIESKKMDLHANMTEMSIVEKDKRIQGIIIGIAMLLIVLSIALSNKHISIKELEECLCNPYYADEYDMMVLDDQWYFTTDDFNIDSIEFVSGDMINVVQYELQVSMEDLHNSVGCNARFEKIDNEWRMISICYNPETTDVRIDTLCTPRQLIDMIHRDMPGEYDDYGYSYLLTCQYMGSYDRGRCSNYYIMWDGIIKLYAIMSVKLDENGNIFVERAGGLPKGYSVDNSYEDSLRYVNDEELNTCCNKDNPILPK